MGNSEYMWNMSLRPVRYRGNNECVLATETTRGPRMTSESYPFKERLLKTYDVRSTRPPNQML